MNKKEIEEKKKKAILFAIGAALSLLIAICITNDRRAQGI